MATSCSTTDRPQAGGPVEPKSSVLYAGKKASLDSPTLDQKIGQMLMFGFRGFQLDRATPLYQLIKEGMIGGIILLDRDALTRSTRNIQSPKQLKELTNQLQDLSPTILFISIDQEGGRIIRLKPEYGFLPSAKAEYLGKTDDLDTTTFYAKRMALELAEAGINMNLAPCVDVNINPANPIIAKYWRSFSPSATMVNKHASIFVDEYNKTGIVPVLKHFPGHGSSTADSHYDMVDITKTWQKTELEPYRFFIQSGSVDAIMAAHVINKNWDATYPATMSKNILGTILRDSLHFEGIIITDDFQMKAISQHYEFEESIEKAINAGVDILLLGNNIRFDERLAEKTIAVIKKLVAQKKVSLETIDKAYNRIVKLKQKMLGGGLGK